MRRTKRARAARALVLVAVLLTSTWSIGANTANAKPAAPDTGATGSSVSSGSTASAAAGPTISAAAQQAAEQTTVVRHGPYNIQAAPPANGASHSERHLSNQFAFGIQKPCSNCYITEMTARLTRADGSTAGISNNLMLHHMVLFNTDAGRQDATCAPGLPLPLGLLGQRFFASGDERTPFTFPTGYGYRVGTGAWNMIWDLMSMSTVPETVYYEMSYKWVPGTTAGMRDTEPVWFDVDQCSDSNISVPAGPSQQRWTWTVNRPGDLVMIGGHLHMHGVNLDVRNDTTGQMICDSVAAYGESPLYVDHHGEEWLSSMSTCEAGAPNPVARLTNGQRVTITSRYNAPEGSNDAMGIAVGFVAPSTGGGSANCVRATNSAHVTAGRATSFLVFAWARGSNAYLGLTSATTSLREGPTGTWTPITTC